MFRLFATLVGLALALSGATVWAAEPAPVVSLAAAGTGAIRPDPATLRGVLPNGLRYAVRSNPNEKGISLRLGVNVGSFEEADNELGVAHFVEHMAFNGTRHFPEGRLERVFTPMGVQIGRDHNAGTDLFVTLYALDLPSTRSDQVEPAFRWLRDVADGILFEDAAVGRERGVILAEREARQDTLSEIREAVEAFSGPGLRSTARRTIGDYEQVRTMTAARLSAFYDRWYRPDNAMVVVVGQLPAEALERKVREAFADWTARGAASPRATASGPDLKRGLETLVLSRPAAPGGVSICRVREADARRPDDIARLKRDSVSAIWRAALIDRLTAAAARPDAPFITGSMVAADENRDSLATCLLVVPAGDRWQEALAGAQEELKRFAAHGPTEEEMEAAVEDMRSRLRGRIGVQATRGSADLAGEILNAELDGGVSADPREELRAFGLAVEDLTPEAVKARFEHDWSGGGPLVVVVTPHALEPEAVRAAWTRGEGGKAPERLKAAAVGAWAYGDFGAAGTVVKREVVAPPGFVRLTFSNGLVLNFKATARERNTIAVRVKFGAGRREISNADYFPALLAAGLLKEGGLGRNSYSDLQALFRTTQWEAELDVGDYAFYLDGATTQLGLRSQLEILAGYMTDASFGSGLDAKIPTSLDGFYRIYRTYPSLVLAEAMADTIAPGGPNSLPPREKVLALKAADFGRLLTPAMRNAPMEVSVVGDVDEKTIIAEVARTFGALPRRAATERVRPDVQYMRYPDHPIVTIHAVHEGPADKAMAGFYWPLYVATPSRRREEYALFMLARVFRDELLRRVREDLGMTYSPEADTYTPDDADQGYLYAAAETYPADIEAVEKEIRAVAARLASGAITSQSLEAARKPMLAGVISEESANAWWLSAISSADGDAQGMKDLIERRAMISGVTLADVKAAAARWLSRPPIVVLAQPAKAAESRP